MRSILRIIGLLLLWPGASQGGGDVPDSGIIIGVAQQLVAQQLGLSADSRFDIAFDLTYIHPQPEPNYWAVVGGFMAALRTDQYEPHSYVAAVRLLCPNYRDLNCWRLDKFALDNRIIFDVDGQRESLRTPYYNERFVLKPQPAMPLDNSLGGLEVIAVPQDFVQSIIVDLGDIHGGVPGRQ